MWQVLDLFTFQLQTYLILVTGILDFFLAAYCFCIYSTILFKSEITHILMMYFSCDLYYGKDLFSSMTKTVSRNEDCVIGCHGFKVNSAGLRFSWVLVQISLGDFFFKTIMHCTTFQWWWGGLEEPIKWCFG